MRESTTSAETTRTSLIVSARELKQFSSYEPAEAIVRLLEVFEDNERHTWNLEQALRGQPEGEHLVAVLA
ncbi:hypothetical protein GCM10009766_22920 [Microcella frigidaquae]